MSVKAPPYAVAIRAYWGIVELLQALWAIGAPAFHVTSWYRDVEENRRVGGHPESQHLYGLALDLAGGTTEERRKLAEDARRAGLVAIEYSTHVHVQRYPAGALRRFGFITT